MDPDIAAAAVAPGLPGDGLRRRRPDSAFVRDDGDGAATDARSKASSPPTTAETAIATAPSSSFSLHLLLLLAFLLGCLCSALSLPLLAAVAEKLTPPVTPARMLPRRLMGPALSLVAAADGLSRAVTPPNLRVLAEVAGAWHAAQLRTAAELRLADFLSEEEERARRECLFGLEDGGKRGRGASQRPQPPPSLGRRLSCSLRLLRFPPSLTSRQLAELAVPRCRGADEAAHASGAAAFAEGSILPREPPLAGCDGVARRVERLLRALSAYGFFVGEEEAAGSSSRDGGGGSGDLLLPSTRWRNSRPSRFLAGSHAHSLRSAVLVMTREGQWGAWGRLPLAVATGRPAFVDPGRLGSNGDAAVEALMMTASTAATAATAATATSVVDACPSSSSNSSLPPPPSTREAKGGDGKAYHPPEDYWNYLESDPSGARAREFDAAMVELNRASASARAAAEDAPFASLWAAAASARGAGAAIDVVDVGGGAGELAAEVLRRHAGVVGRAVVVDLPRVAARARRAWACAAAAAAAAAAKNSSSSSSRSSSSAECPASLLALAPHALDYPSELRSRISFSEGTMFSAKSLSAAVERGLGSFAAAEEEEEEQGAAAAAAARGSRRTPRKRKSPRRVQPRRRRLFLLRDVIHDWSDAETVKILTALRKSMGSAEEDGFGGGDDGRASFSSPSHHHHHHHHHRNRHQLLLDRGDRVLIVGRDPPERPARGPLAYVRSKGAHDADLLMLAIFGGGGAGERTRAQARRLLEEAGLELVAVHPTRSWFSVTEARVKEQ